MSENGQNVRHLKTRCCIVGGGPAGIMLGFLLARGGIDVLVLEKHADFFRDFRGDTLHPSTLELMHELDLLEELLKLPHQEVSEMKLKFDDRLMTVADFSSLDTRCRFIAFMPQWDFLDFLTRQAASYPTFRLKMSADVVGLVEKDGVISGVRAKTPQGDLEVSADLVIGADGRHSTVRERAGLEVIDRGAPIDVLWFRLSRSPADPGQSGGFLRANRMMVMLDRGDYWQCGIVIPKGMFDDIRNKNLETFQSHIVSIVPFMQDRVLELKDWEQVKLLTVRIDRLREWYRPGLLCIGDAAHAMSPVGGFGINIAIQDAVAAANIISVKLRKGFVPVKDLKKVQERRERAVRMTQAMQVFIQERLLGPVLGKDRRLPPLFFSLFGRFPLLRRLMARAIGIGFQPEHARPFFLG